MTELNPTTREHEIKLKLALAATHEDLGAAYESILNVLNAQNISDNLRMAAFGVRELLIRLPDYVNAPFKENHDKLGMLTKDLKEKWKGQKIEACIEVTWNQVHVEQIKRFLIECKVFFQLNDEIHFSKREKAIATSRTLNAKYSEESLPDDIEVIIATRWNSFLDYFNKVAHSEYGSTDKNLFITQLASLEEYLINLLEPNVFDSMDEIDEIIRLGEADAN